MPRIIEFYICFLNLFCSNSFISKSKYIIYGIISLLCLLKIVENRRKIIVNPKTDLGMYFFIFMLISIFPIFYWDFTDKFNDIISAYIRVWLMVPILLYISYFKNLNIPKAIVNYSYLINLISFFDLLNNIDKFGRIHSIFSHPNFYAFYLIIVIISIIHEITIKQIDIKVGTIYIIFNLFMIISAGSKTSLIAISIALLYTYRNYIKKRNLLFRILFTSVVCIIFMIIFYKVKDNLINYRIFNIDYGVQANQVDSFSWRLLNWKAKFQSWDDNIFGIIFGYGIGSEILYDFKGFAMHNEYLRILFDCGILGLSIITCFGIKVVKQINKIINPEDNIFLKSILIIIIIGSFSENLFVATETCILYLSIIFSVNQYLEKKRLIKMDYIN